MLETQEERWLGELEDKTQEIVELNKRITVRPYTGLGLFK